MITEAYIKYRICGRVKSLNYNHTGKEKLLNQCYDTRKYLMVVLYKNGKRKTFKVHRLVALMFIPNEENKPEVNHKHRRQNRQ